MFCLKLYEKTLWIYWKPLKSVVERDQMVRLFGFMDLELMDTILNLS